MILEGTVLTTDDGHRVIVGREMASGGQGVAYNATYMQTGEDGVLKAFSPKCATRDTAERISYLVGQRLDTACPSLFPPKRRISRNGIIGYMAARAPGTNLQTCLENPGWTVKAGLEVAATVADAIALLESRNIAHGDIRSANMNLNSSGLRFALGIFDFDNFNAPGVPPPQMIGDVFYFAPELRRPQVKHARPDVRSDRFALGVVMHELILLIHPAHGGDHDAESLDKTMLSGWVHDPARTLQVRPTAGHTPRILNADLSRLLRRSLSNQPDDRPTAREWGCELRRAIGSLWTCSKCGGPNFIDSSKTGCAHCRGPFPVLELAGHGFRIRLDTGSVRVGRDSLGGSTRVSAIHAVFRRVGPTTWIEPLGSNGTCKLTGGVWAPLPNHASARVSAGDRLLLGDVVVKVVAT